MPARMPKTKKGKRKVASDEMRKFAAGKLHSGSPSGPIVKNPAQAKAIAMSVSGQGKKRRKLEDMKI